MEQLPDNRPETVSAELMSAATVYDALAESGHPLEDAFGITLYALNEKHELPYEGVLYHLRATQDAAHHSWVGEIADKQAIDELCERMNARHVEYVQEVADVVNGLVQELPALFYVRIEKGDNTWLPLEQCTLDTEVSIPALMFKAGDKVFRGTRGHQVRCGLKSLPPEAQDIVTRYVELNGE